MNKIRTFEFTKGTDKIKMTVLGDGTIKTETDRISAPNHSSAEGFLSWVAKMAGGVVKSVRKGGAAHTHTHSTGETHTH